MPFRATNTQLRREGSLSVSDDRFVEDINDDNRSAIVEDLLGETVRFLVVIIKKTTKNRNKTTLAVSFSNPENLS